MERYLIPLKEENFLPKDEVFKPNSVLLLYHSQAMVKVLLHFMKDTGSVFILTFQAELMVNNVREIFDFQSTFFERLKVCWLIIIIRRNSVAPVRLIL